MVLRDLREPLALLLLAARDEQGLGHADRLVRGEERRQRGVAASGDHQRPVVGDLGKPEPAVLLGHLHPERAERLQAIEDLGGDPRVALDLQRVDLGLEELAQLAQEGRAPARGGLVESGLRMDEVDPQRAQEQLPAEARQLPLRLARLLGDATRLALAYLCGHRASCTRPAQG